MDNPNNAGEGIAPPRTGEFPLAQLMQYPNAVVRALAHHLRHEFGFWNADSFTGEYICHLYNFVERGPDGRFDFARIQAGAGEGDGRQSRVSVVRYNEGHGPAPHRIEYIQSRSAILRSSGTSRVREDGSINVDSTEYRSEVAEYASRPAQETDVGDSTSLRPLVIRGRTQTRGSSNRSLGF
jgi:hypothetical protein